MQWVPASFRAVGCYAEIPRLTPAVGPAARHRSKKPLHRCQDSHSRNTPQPFGMLYLRPLRSAGTALQFHAFDAAYVENLRAGDPRTQEHFVGYFTELLHLKLRARLQSPQAVEDVRQETFARVLAGLGKPRAHCASPRVSEPSSIPSATMFSSSTTGRPPAASLSMKKERPKYRPLGLTR